MVAPEKASTCRSTSAKGEWIEKVYDYVVACNSRKTKISQMKVVEDFESRPHKAVSFLVEREKETQEWNEQKLPKVLLGYSGGRLPGRSVKEKGREEGKVDEGSGEREMRQEIAQEVVAGIKEKASAQDDAKATAQRTAGQRVKQNWDCSKVGNEEEEEEEEDDCQKEDQMAVQWEEEQKLEEILERRRMEGSSLQVEVMEKVPELDDRKSQVEKQSAQK